MLANLNKKVGLRKKKTTPFWHNPPLALFYNSLLISLYSAIQPTHKPNNWQISLEISPLSFLCSSFLPPVEIWQILLLFMFSTIPISVTERDKSNLIFNLFSPPHTKIWQNSPQVYLFNLFYEFIFHPNRRLDRQPPVVRKPVQEIVLVFLSFSLSVAFQWDLKINICRF